MQDLQDLYALPLKAAEYMAEHGWAQGTEKDDAGRVCLTGALRYCDPRPGDWLIARGVYRARGRAESWNDEKGRTADEVLSVLHAEITDADLADTFGPQWLEIVALVRRAAVLTPDEAKALAAAGAAARAAAWALVVRDLIGQHGFTQEHHDTLTGPWSKVIGPVHPDDAAVA